MTYIQTWDNETKTILRQTFSGTWSMDEYHHSVDLIAETLKDQPQVVHVIIDMTNTIAAPHNLLSGARYAEKKLHGKLKGINIFVGPNVLVRSTIELARKLGLRVAQNTYTTVTLEEAYQRIASLEDSMQKL